MIVKFEMKQKYKLPPNSTPKNYSILCQQAHDDLKITFEGYKDLIQEHKDNDLTKAVKSVVLGSLSKLEEQVKRYRNMREWES